MLVRNKMAAMVTFVLMACSGATPGPGLVQVGDTNVDASTDIQTADQQTKDQLVADKGSDGNVLDQSTQPDDSQAQSDLPQEDKFQGKDITEPNDGDTGPEDIHTDDIPVIIDAGGVCSTVDDCPVSALVCSTAACMAGKCVFEVTPNCCDSDSNCLDNNLCTVDTCDADNHCQHTPVADPLCCMVVGDCPDDGDPCTDTTCVGNQCNNADRCPESDCDATGQCFKVECSTVAECDDQNPCTTDVCDPTGHTCTHILKPLSACCSADAECDDGYPCTKNTCNPSTHLCEKKTLTDCCTIDKMCDDGDACTTDTCNQITNECVNTLKSVCCTQNADCVSAEACTVGYCDGLGQCQYQQDPTCCTADAQCDDGLFCTRDVCNQGSHLCEHPGFCPYQPAGCDEGNKLCPIPACVSDSDCSGLSPDPWVCSFEAGSPVVETFMIYGICQSSGKCKVYAGTEICTNGCSSEGGCF